MFSRRTEWRLAPNRFSQEIERAHAAGQRLLDLSISNPTRAGISYDGKAIVASLANPGVLDYDPQPKGAPSAREAVAEYYLRRGDIVSVNQLILTASTSEGYSHVFRLLANAGEEVLIPKPSYPLFDFLADLQDVKLLPYPLIYDHGWQIDFHSLASAVTPATRAIVLVNPNNPTGSYVSEKERKELNEICREHNLALIVDEVFLDYSLGASRYPSFAANNDALTFTLSGLSKISALPQMKLGWVAVSGPADLATIAMDRLEVIADTYLSVSAPVQLAASTLLGQRTLIQPQIAERTRRNLDLLDEQIANQKACTRLCVQGGWYAVLRVPVTQSDEDLAITLLREHSVLVHPGHFYDFPQDGYLVLSLITPQEEFREGIARILEVFANNAL
jgi:alanine-synthesizing transaminase